MNTLTTYDSKTQTFTQKNIEGEWVGLQTFANNEAGNEIAQKLGALDRFITDNNVSLDEDLHRMFSLARVAVKQGEEAVAKMAARKGFEFNGFDALIAALIAAIAVEFPAAQTATPAPKSFADILNAATFSTVTPVQSGMTNEQHDTLRAERYATYEASFLAHQVEADNLLMSTSTNLLDALISVLSNGTMRLDDAHNYGKSEYVEHVIVNAIPRYMLTEKGYWLQRANISDTRW